MVDTPQSLMISTALQQPQTLHASSIMLSSMEQNISLLAFDLYISSNIKTAAKESEKEISGNWVVRRLFKSVLSERGLKEESTILSYCILATVRTYRRVWSTEQFFNTNLLVPGYIL